MSSFVNSGKLALKLGIREVGGIEFFNLPMTLAQSVWLVAENSWSDTQFIAVWIPLAAEHNHPVMTCA